MIVRKKKSRPSRSLGSALTWACPIMRQGESIPLGTGIVTLVSLVFLSLPCGSWRAHPCFHLDDPFPATLLFPVGNQSKRLPYDLLRGRRFELCE